VSSLGLESWHARWFDDESLISHLQIATTSDVAVKFRLASYKLFSGKAAVDHGDRRIMDTSVVAIQYAPVRDTPWRFETSTCSSGPAVLDDCMDAD